MRLRAHLAWSNPGDALEQLAECRFALVAQLLGVLRRVESGRVRARALPAGGELAVTILAFDELVPDNEVYAEINEAELAR